MKLTKPFLVQKSICVERSLRIAKDVLLEFESEKDWLNVRNQKLVVARLEGKLELINEIIR